MTQPDWSLLWCAGIGAVVVLMAARLSARQGVASVPAPGWLTAAAPGLAGVGAMLVAGLLLRVQGPGRPVNPAGSPEAVSGLWQPMFEWSVAAERRGRPGRIDETFALGSHRRGDELFRGGRYRVGTARVRLVDGAGTPLKEGTATTVLPVQIEVILTPEPGPEDGIFAAPGLAQFSLSTAVPPDRPGTVVDPFRRGADGSWSARVPVEKQSLDGAGRVSLGGLVFVMGGRAARYHVTWNGIWVDGRVAPGGHVWMGCLPDLPDEHPLDVLVPEPADLPRRPANQG